MPPPIAAHMARGGEPPHAAKPKKDQPRCRGKGSRLVQKWNGTCSGDVPARIAKQRSRSRVPRTNAEPVERLGGAQAVKTLRRVASLFLLGGGDRPPDQTLKQRFEAIGDRDLVVQPLRVGVRVTCAVVVFFLDDLAHEPVAVPRHGADVNRIPRIIAQCPPQRPDRLAQRAVRDDHVGPHAIEDVATVYRLGAALDEEHEQIEVAWDQRQFAAGASEHPLPGREDEVGKTVALQALRTYRETRKRLKPRGFG